MEWAIGFLQVTYSTAHFELCQSLNVMMTSGFHLPMKTRAVVAQKLGALSTSLGGVGLFANITQFLLGCCESSGSVKRAEVTE
jgi:hypothetical protein